MTDDGNHFVYGIGGDWFTEIAPTILCRKIFRRGIEGPRPRLLYRACQLFRISPPFVIAITFGQQVEASDHPIGSARHGDAQKPLSFYHEATN